RPGRTVRDSAGIARAGARALSPMRAGPRAMAGEAPVPSGISWRVRAWPSPSCFRPRPGRCPSAAHPLVPPQDQGAGDVDAGVGAGDDADEEGEGEVVDGAAAEKVKGSGG